MDTTGLNAVLGGRYLVERELARGGMATVFLATDLRHNRKVAIKVLRAELASAVGAERFLREIRVTANLHHPHILPLHDSGEAGTRESGDWQLYYVMPFVEGESLRDRLVRERQLGFDEAVRIAKQVAGALEHAHRRGIVHRDLKPENILLQDGEALVADFGVARAVERATDTGSLTTAGVTVGTPHYMSPEQAAGETDLDGRTDVFSLGCVFYEMLAGVSPFAAPTTRAVIARVMADDPRPLATVRRTVPRHIESAVTRALAKVPGDRFASAAEFGAALETPVARAESEPSAGALTPADVPARASSAWRWRDVGLAAVALLSLGAAVWQWRRASDVPTPGVHRFELRLPAQLTGIAVQTITLSADGKVIVYVAFDGTRRLYVRRFNESTVHPIAGTEGAFAPALSSDGRSVAFLTAHQLKKVDLDGGAAVVVADIGSLGLAPTMSWWGDVIVYESGRTPPRSALYRVSARNGSPTVLTDTASGVSYSTPDVLPGGHAVVCTLWRPTGERGVYAISLDTRARTLLVRDALSPRYVAGNLLYATPEGTVFRRPFDARSLRFTGDPVPVLTGVALVSRTTQLAVSETGTLVYLPDSLAANGLAMISRDGALTPLPLLGAPRQRYLSLPRFSPDGRRIVVPVAPNPSLLDSTALWVYNRDDSGFSPFIWGDASKRSPFRYVGFPEWTPDGRRISFVALGTSRAPGLYTASSDGSGVPSLLVAADGWMEGHSWGPDGRWLVVRRGDAPETTGGSGFDLWRVDLAATPGPAGTKSGSHAQPLVATSAEERQPAVSPDGRWLAYASNESGTYEVYVRALDAAGGRVRVSVDGGLEPRWARDGTELFYRSHEMLMSAPVRSTATFAVGPRTPLFRLADSPSIFGTNYDVEPNGRGFVSRWRSDPDIVLVVLDWFSDWKNERAAR